MLKTEEEIKNLELDKPGRGKSIEQIRKHSLAENFVNKPIDRALQLLTKGDDIQKLSIIQELPELIKADANAAYTRIIPKIQQELVNSSCEFHVATSKSFKFLIDKQVPVNVMPTILQGLESRDPIVVNAWLETLVNVIPSLPEDIVRKEILVLAINKATLSQPVASRVVSCTVLGKLAVYAKFKPVDVKAFILPTTQSLCQDVSAEVRAEICSQIPYICQGIGMDLARSSLISSLVELASDFVPTVRAAAVVTIVQIFPYVDNATKKATILPLVKQLCEKSLSRDDTTGTTVTKEFGRLVTGLQSCMTAPDIVWFLTCYKTLGHRGLLSKAGDSRGDPAMDMVCRDNCAYNLPAMAHIIITKASDQIELMYTIFRDLTADPCYIVRKSVAASIHEIIKILGNNSKLVKADLVRLLRDDAEEVLQALVPHIGNTLVLMCQFGTLSKDKADQSTMEIGRALLKCQLELTKGYNWRLLTQLLKQQERLPECIPSDFIHQHFTPVILGNVLNGRARPVREQGARTLLIFLKYNNKDTQQKWIRDTLITQLCYSKSSYTRIIFIKLCANALEIFSVQYFKDFFFIPAISLIDDPVSNIRYCLVCMLPALKQMVTPTDTKLRQILNDAIIKLESRETDHDVLEKYKTRVKEFCDLKAKPSMIMKGGISVGQMSPMGPRLSVQSIRSVRNLTMQSMTIPISASQPSVASSISSQQISPPPPQRSTSAPEYKPRTIPQQIPAAAPKAPQPQRSINVPPPAAAARRPPPSDMSFLEQHFYVDAGVSLPVEHISNSQTIDSESICAENSELSVVSDIIIEGLTELEIKVLENSTTNITDDVKVNLRNISKQVSKIVAPKVYTHNSDTYKNINKRHSSIFSSSCMDSKSLKNTHRRSLNIQPRDFSKIPVCSKSPKQEKSPSCTNIDKLEWKTKKALYFEKNKRCKERVNVNKKELCKPEDKVQVDIKENVVPSKINIVLKSNSKLPSSLPLAKKKTLGEA